jgi:hypothetical protein
MCPPESFWSIRLPDLINAFILMATIFAIIYGPIKAVEITRRKDFERDSFARKRQIFAALMRTRKATVTPDHVGALNQIQLEFYEFPNVVEKYRAYIGNLSETVPASGNDLQNFFNRRSDLFFDLLQEVGVASGVKLDRHDLDRLAYTPLGWQTDEQEIKMFRNSLIDVLQGKKSLHVVAGKIESQPIAPYNPFPPPPA